MRNFSITVTGKELKRFRTSQKESQNHDFSLYVVKDGWFLAIAKHFYPDALFSAVGWVESGGII